MSDIEYEICVQDFEGKFRRLIRDARIISKNGSIEKLYYENSNGVWEKITKHTIITYINEFGNETLVHLNYNSQTDEEQLSDPEIMPDEYKDVKITVYHKSN